MARIEVEIPYSPRAVFLPFHNRTERWACIVAHRRCGKTVACINDLVKRALTEGKQDARYAYVAPYYGQAKAVAWDYLLKYSQPVSKQVNHSELWVELVNGSRIRLFGSDNADAMRGIALDGVVIDETADHKPRVWGEILRPALSDRNGWGAFIGTPKGHDAFYETYQKALASQEWYASLLRSSETGILPQTELDDARSGMTADQYAQEFECSFEAAILGAIYAKELDEARSNNRITQVPHDKTLKVDTYWDLGVGDSTSIIFTQSTGREIRIIDYYEASGEGLPHYASILQSKGYLYGKHNAPHDIQVRELGSGRSRLETASSLGIKFDVVPNASLEDGIHAARMLMGRCLFDKDKCFPLIEALQHYRWDYNDKMGQFKTHPVHDWSSHAADAYRYLAIGHKDKQTRPNRLKENISWMG